MMDEYTTFYVYNDKDAAGNHFFPSGWMGDLSAIKFDGGWSEAYSGTSCIRIDYKANNNWAGIYWQYPENNWGNMREGYNLTGATKLTFWAKGEKGGEVIKFFVGGIDGKYSDSLPKVSIKVRPTKEWRKYTIDLKNYNLSHVIGGFGWVASSYDNPRGATFYLDEIKYDLKTNKPRFLRSFITITTKSPDKYIQNAAFVYDNALALIAFLAMEDYERAKLIADAFVTAQNNDRFYKDGRLRNAYMAGDLLYLGKARLPGWWDEKTKRWYEDEYQASSYAGNMAWVVIALASYYEEKGGEEYKNAAIKLGEWIYRENDKSGYTGGYKGWEPNAEKIRWKSTEHNIDVYVAFMHLYKITGDKKWYDGAMKAKNFVESMWNGEYFYTGTFENGSINKEVVPLDIQAWAVMAFNNYSKAVEWAEINCYVEVDGFKGFDFNTDRDGVWFEGTSHMALAYKILGEDEKADLYLSEIEKGISKGVFASSHDGVTTGFDWNYFKREHVGATSWYIFAKLGYNPYWGKSDSAVNQDNEVRIMKSEQIKKQK